MVFGPIGEKEMCRSLTVEQTTIDDSSDCYVIAEIGHNHQGDLEKAKAIIRAAHECGANAVKLQKRDNKSLYTAQLYNAPYDHENSFGMTYGLHREALEFGREEYRELKALSGQLGLAFFATAFDFPSVEFLADLDVPAFKVASGDLKNTPLLKCIAQVGKPIFLSTGGGTMEDVKRAYDVIAPINPRLCILQCTAAYPAEAEDMNLTVIRTFRDHFPVVVGLSDHQNGISMSTIAFCLGARVIEKHFTLNHAWKGTDHAFSLEPIGMRKLVRDLRRARLALGDGTKRPLPCEAKPLFKMAKKLVAAHDIPAGAKLTWEDIAIKSPGDGVPPCEADRILDRVTRREISRDENLTSDDLCPER